MGPIESFFLAHSNLLDYFGMRYLEPQALIDINTEMLWTYCDEDEDSIQFAEDEHRLLHSDGDYYSLSINGKTYTSIDGQYIAVKTVTDFGDIAFSIFKLSNKRELND